MPMRHFKIIVLKRFSVHQKTKKQKKGKRIETFSYRFD